jgi:hypothetical protein
VGLSPLGTAATSGLLYKPQMIDEGDCGAVGGMKIGRGNRSTRRKPAPAPLCPPQIPHDQTRARTRADLLLLVIIFNILILTRRVHNQDAARICFCLWRLSHTLPCKSPEVLATRFNVLKLCILPTECICMFRVVLTTRSILFP